MAIAQRRDERIGPESEPVRTATEVATHAGARRGMLATAFSAVAVVASCTSLYLGTLQAPHLEIYLPPAFQYAMDGEGENFTIPVTVANGGARSGTVVSMELEVEDAKTKAMQRFYSAYLGENPRGRPNAVVRQFAPMAVLGHAVVTEAVRFYPVTPTDRSEEKRIVSDAGEYTFRLKINTAAPAEPSLIDWLQGRTQPPVVTVTMVLPAVDYRGLMQMRSKDWLAAQGKPSP